MLIINYGKRINVGRLGKYYRNRTITRSSGNFPIYNYSNKCNTDFNDTKCSEEKLQYKRYLSDPMIPIVICTGPTGSGKTYMACKEGINQLNNGSYEKLLITRPAVSIDNEQHGYLPGTLNKKMDPWIRPIYDNIEDIIGIKQLDYLIKHKVIEICPFAYIRGRTFKNTYIIADEMQNSSRMQFKTLLTRIGESSKIVVNGDLLQSDNSSNDGLNDFITRLIEYSKNNERKYTKIVNLLNDDIQRHPSILEVLDIYSERISYLN